MADPLIGAEPAYDVDDEYRPEPEPIPEPPAWQDGSFRIGIHTSIAGDIAGKRWSTSDIFTPRISTTHVGVSQRSPSRNQAWMVVHPLSNEPVWTPSATVIANMRERIIEQ